MLFTTLWISVLINIPLVRSRNTIPIVEISLSLFGTSSLSEHLGAPDGLFKFQFKRKRVGLIVLAYVK